MTYKASIILPAKNESKALNELLPILSSKTEEFEIIVVDDGSTDDTVNICKQYKDIKLIEHPYSKGNGAAIKSGARAATGDVLIFMDADGQHNPENIYKLLELYEKGYDMVVGAREYNSHASLPRYIANAIYNRLASWITGKNILDLTSGFRLVRADIFRKFIYLLPNGFSYPTTITMAMFRAGYNITYVPIEADERIGNSHIKLINDGIRFLLIIFKVGTLYSPLKIFFPVSFLFFISGLINYLYTYILQARFTNMSALLFITSILIFFIGLLSEQITTLFYKSSGDE